MYQRAELIAEELQRIDGISLVKASAKHQKMATSPFAFYRGSAQLFYADVSNGTIQLPTALSRLPHTAVMGDCHASNFGFFTEEGSHGDRVIFAANDFDDACIGRAEWDLFRFIVSLILAVEHCKSSPDYAGKLADKTLVRHAITAFLQSYIDCCNQGLQGREHLQFALDESRLEAYPFLMKFYKKAKKRAVGGKNFLSKSSLAKAVVLDSTKPAFRQLPEKFQRLSQQQYSELEQAFAPYMHDFIWDIVVRKNAGTGSINMSRYYFLVGPAEPVSSDYKALFHLVEVKKQRQAAPIHFFPELNPANRLNPAHLTVMCQRKMQRFPDLVLDEVEWKQKHWLVRSRHHAKLGMDPEDLAMGEGAINEKGFVQYAQACGFSLALAHCRGDRRSTGFEAQVCSVLPDFIGELQGLAFSYSRHVINDWLWLKEHLTEEQC